MKKVPLSLFSLMLLLVPIGCGSENTEEAQNNEIPMENEAFLLLNVTIEDLLEIKGFGLRYARSRVEASEGRTFRQEDDELYQEPTKIGDSVSTIDLV